MKKFQREALERAKAEAAPYGCTVVLDPQRPYDGRGHMRLIITHEASGLSAVHTLGGSPKSRDAMVDGVGNQARRKSRALAGRGPTG